MHDRAVGGRFVGRHAAFRSEPALPPPLHPRQCALSLACKALRPLRVPVRDLEPLCPGFGSRAVCHRTVAATPRFAERLGR